MTNVDLFRNRELGFDVFEGATFEGENQKLTPWEAVPEETLWVIFLTDWMYLYPEVDVGVEGAEEGGVSEEFGGVSEILGRTLAAWACSGV